MNPYRTPKEEADSTFDLEEQRRCYKLRLVFPVVLTLIAIFALLMAAESVGG